MVAGDTRPVLGLFDFDPQGLLMAAGLPRCEALCLPPWDLLETLVIDRKRHDLYAAQEAGCRAQLDACADQDVATAWARMRLLTLGCLRRCPIEPPRRRSTAPPD